MAKKTVARSRRNGDGSAEKEMVQKLSDMLRAAKFEIQHQFDLDKPAYPDLIAGREDLGVYRRYAIQVDVVDDANSLIGSLAHLQDYAETRKNSDFDEFWLVSNLSYPDRPRKRVARYQNVRAFAFKELQRLLAKSTPKRRASPNRGTAKTQIGKAIEANEKSIQLAITALILQIDAKVEILGDQRPNSPDAKAERDMRILEFERMRNELENIRQLVARFVKGKEEEAAVVNSVSTLKGTVKNWWIKGHGRILDTASDGSVFVALTGVLHMLGANSTVALAILGSLIGGETVVKSLKALPRKLF